MCVTLAGSGPPTSAVEEAAISVGPRRIGSGDASEELSDPVPAQRWRPVQLVQASTASSRLMPATVSAASPTW